MKKGQSDCLASAPCTLSSNPWFPPPVFDSPWAFTRSESRKLFGRFSQSLVASPPFVGSALRQTQQLFCSLRVAVLQDSVATLGVDIVLQWNGRSTRIKLKRILAFR